MPELRPIPSAGGLYLAGDDGRIWSAKRGMPLKPFLVEGYEVVCLYVGGRTYERRVNRLVAEAWCDGFNSMTEAHHIDGDRRNNRPSNLAALSPAAHLRIHGKHVDDIEFADCEAAAASAPPVSPLHRAAERIDEDGAGIRAGEGRTMNDLEKVNAIVFRELERLESCPKEHMADEIERARTIKGLSDTVISNGNLVLRAAQASTGVAEAVRMPKMLGGE